jgi:hypothetical protein
MTLRARPRHQRKSMVRAANFSVLWQTLEESGMNSKLLCEPQHFFSERQDSPASAHVHLSHCHVSCLTCGPGWSRGLPLPHLPKAVPFELADFLEYSPDAVGLFCFKMQRSWYCSTFSFAFSVTCFFLSTSLEQLALVSCKRASSALFLVHALIQWTWHFVMGHFYSHILNVVPEMCQPGPLKIHFLSPPQPAPKHQKQQNY